MVRLPAWRASPRDATAALLAAYAERVGRPFPPGLLPDGPLRPVGRSLPARLHAALFAAWHRDPRLRGVDLLFGSAATRRPLIPLSRTEFLRRAPIGYFVAGFAAKPLGDLKFYYMWRDAWRQVLFRFSCIGAQAVPIGSFLERFDAFCRALSSPGVSLIAFEKDGFVAQYEVTTPQRTMASDRSRLADPDFARLLEGAPS